MPVDLDLAEAEDEPVLDDDDDVSLDCTHRSKTKISRWPFSSNEIRTRHSWLLSLEIQHQKQTPKP